MINRWRSLSSSVLVALVFALSFALHTPAFSQGTGLDQPGWALFGSWVDSPNTYFGTLNNFDVPFITNGTEKMRLFTSGGLSIGDMNDPGATNLNVVGSVTSPLLYGGDATGEMQHLQANPTDTKLVGKTLVHNRLIVGDDDITGGDSPNEPHGLQIAFDGIHLETVDDVFDAIRVATIQRTDPWVVGSDMTAIRAFSAFEEFRNEVGETTSLVRTRTFGDSTIVRTQGTFTIGDYAGVHITPTFTGGLGRTMNITTLTGFNVQPTFVSFLTMNVTTYTGLRVRDIVYTSPGVYSVGTEVGVDIESLTHGSTANISLRSAGSNEMRHNGAVVIGNTSAATSLLNVGSSNQFQVDSSGNIIKLNNVTTSFPSSNSTGVLANNGSGTYSIIANGAAGGGLPSGSASQTLRYNSGWVASSVLTNDGTDISITGALNVGSAAQFIVNSSGNITKLNNVTTSFPSANAAGVLVNNGSGTYSIVANGATSGGLPSGTSTQTLRHNGTSWVANSAWQNDGTNVLATGTITGQSSLTIGSSGQFVVNSSGNITKLNNVTTSFPSSNSTGVLANNGSGTYSIIADGNAGGGLPSGSSTNTLRHNGSAWVANSAWQNDGTNVKATGDATLPTIYGAKSSTSGNLTLDAQDGAFAFADTGRIILKDRVVFNETASVTASLRDNFIRLTGSYSTNNATFVLTGLMFDPTFNYSTALTAALSPAFWAKPVFRPSTSSADSAGAVQMTGFAGQPSWSPNGSSITPSTPVLMGFWSGPTSSITSGTSGTVTNVTSFGSYNDALYNALAAFSPDFGSGITVTNLRGFHHGDPVKHASATITNNIGVDIEKLAVGTNLIGIRNASTTVYTPSTMTVTAAGNTIPTNATAIRMNNTSGGQITLNATPLIADGQNGQVIYIFNSSAQNVVITNGTANNIRLAGAANLTLGQNDSVTIMFSSDIGDWIQIGASNN